MTCEVYTQAHTIVSFTKLAARTPDGSFPILTRLGVPIDVFDWQDALFAQNVIATEINATCWSYRVVVLFET